MRLAYVTNLPAPYRVAFLNELGKLCDLTAYYERHSASNRDATWRGGEVLNYREVYCADRPVGTDKSLGFDLAKRIRTQQFDRLLISGYSSPAVMALILDCQKHGTEYFMQYDGGFATDSVLKEMVKRRLLRPAAGHFTSSEMHAAYLRTFGISPARIWKYPFTSLTEEGILSKPISNTERVALRHSLGVTEKHMVLAVGRFIPRKGFDILMKSAKLLREKDIGFYLVGGEARPEYKMFCRMNDLTKVHFVGFMQPAVLRHWYQAADVFCLPTRGDTWGLVINEAMANALPVITTTSCGAGLELVREGENGALVPPEDPIALAEAIGILLSSDTIRMRRASLDTIRKFTAAEMARAHAERLL